MSRTFKIAAALVLAAALLAPAAAAQVAVQSASTEVSHAGLDLTAKADATTLLQRMKWAAGKVCGERPSPRQIRATAQHTACTRSAMKGAVEALNVPMVTALFDGQAGTEVAAR